MNFKLWEQRIAKHAIWVMGSIPTRTKLRNNLGQVVHTYAPWYWSKDGDILWLGR